MVLSTTFCFSLIDLFEYLLIKFIYLFFTSQIRSPKADCVGQGQAARDLLADCRLGHGRSPKAACFEAAESSVCPKPPDEMPSYTLPQSANLIQG